MSIPEEQGAEEQGAPPEIILSATPKQKRDFLELLLNEDGLLEGLLDPDQAQRALREAGIQVSEGALIRIRSRNDLPTREQMETALAMLEAQAKAFPDDPVGFTGEPGHFVFLVEGSSFVARIGLTHAMPFVAVDEADG
jgi:hypothetical protein